MKLSKLGEFGLIQRIRKKHTCLSPGVITAIGDDTAVVTIKDRNTLITSDMMIEGVHFDLSFTTFSQLGYKFLAVNISDIFAMGGRPDYFFISIGIPEDLDVNSIDELYSGIDKIARTFGIAITGGDTCASRSGLVLSGTLVGHGEKIVTRSGAKEGDGIFVNSTLGDSAMGLHLLKKRRRRVNRFSPLSHSMKLMKKHLMPVPVPLENRAPISSMIDVSDGLLSDLSHICEESGKGAVIYEDRIPLSRALLATAKRLGKDPLEFAFKGGEDYTLLFTAPSDYHGSAYRIGEIISKGRYIIDGKGIKRTFKPEGYEHFK